MLPKKYMILEDKFYLFYMNRFPQALNFGEAGRKDSRGRPTDGIHLPAVGD